MSVLALHPEMVVIEGHLHYDADTPLDTARRDIEQVSADATYGTYSRFPSWWRDKWLRTPDQLVTCTCNRSGQNKTEFHFIVGLSATALPYGVGMFQHLVGVLVDSFYPTVSGGPSPKFTITDVHLPQMSEDTAHELFLEGRDRTPAEVRHEFGLEESQPLLAFSFKPRLGTRFDVLKEVTLQVLKAGFQIVELDTRNLMLGDASIQKLVDLAKEAVEAGRGRVTRFSPNLSAPAHLVPDLAWPFVDAQVDPVVVKIDGGLDGISACQAIRTWDQDRHPVITSYPLLRKQLGSRVPPQLYTRMLALSGVDVLYPGGRPSFAAMRGACSTPELRDLLPAEQGELVSSVNAYRRYTTEQLFMPTIAGGIHAAELHAYYELLGPDTGYFLGGAVALHKRGPIEGARLCAKILQQAAELRARYPANEWPPDLPRGLVDDVETGFGGSLRVAYLPPERAFSKVARLSSWFSEDR